MTPLMTPEQLADKALKADDISRTKVVIPEWKNATYWVVSMNVGEREEFIEAYGDCKNRLRELLIIFTVQTEDGRQVFKVEQVEDLRKKNAVAIERLFSVSNDLNKLTDDKMQDIAKNSDATQNEDSSSD